ncbi:MAG: ABC transporter permease [Bacilli bacterium]|jgi:peptide/nickel transport system permease protein|nr:ABC transporter permease [Bacilli bacterium]
MKANMVDLKREIKLFGQELLEKLKSGFKTLFANSKSTAGTLIMVFFIFFATFGPLIWPYDNSTDALNKFLTPSWEHILGTDELGRDLFRQLVDGSRDVMSIALLTSIFTVFLGVFLGMLSGLLGGWADKIIMTITNLFLSIPSFPALLMLSAFLNIDNAFSFALVLSIWSWAGLARAVRSQIISLKERDFILICKVMNVNKIHIIFSELIPNLASYILINFILIMRNAIIGSVGIMMLGLASFQPSNWGAMLFRAKAVITSPKAIYLLMSPIVAITLFQTGALFLANGLDEALNPRLRKN